MSPLLGAYYTHPNTLNQEGFYSFERFLTLFLNVIKGVTLIKLSCRLLTGPQKNVKYLLKQWVES